MIVERWREYSRGRGCFIREGRARAERVGSLFAIFGRRRGIGVLRWIIVFILGIFRKYLFLEVFRVGFVYARGFSRSRIRDD